MTGTHRKVILVIRDGWGYRKECSDNAICEADPKETNSLMDAYPHTLLNACGEAVGLPPGYQGNSEVGHMTIGSGRIIFQSLERINKSIKDGDFFANPALLQAMRNAKLKRSTLHLIGLLQVEGVHSQIDHLFALLDLCKKEGVENVCVHVITDGRDSPVHDSLKHLAALSDKLRALGLGRIATVSGRYYAMDRDKRWERTRQAYDCLVVGKSERVFKDPIGYVTECHAKQETDEFIMPGKVDWYAGIKPHDSVIFWNFRTDRPRQLTQAIVERDFTGWERKPLDVVYVGMTQYYRPMNALVAFADQSLANLLGEVVARQGLRQLRISETEKYAHVTFFFNGQKEEPNPGEERILIPSPKVATYDLKPEMSVYEITDRLVAEINKDAHDLVVVNLVNGDMVGHTGIRDAIIKAIQAVDECTGRVVSAGLGHGYTLLVFADHGNAEDQTAAWRTSHTINPVPLMLVTGDDSLKHCRLRAGKGLRDIAPTVLELMGIPKPAEMTGESIIEHAKHDDARKTLSDEARRVQDALKTLGIESDIRELPQSTHTAKDAAAAIGCSVEQIAKSIVFKGAETGKPFLVIASGPNRVNEKTIAALAGEALMKADAAFVLAQTGYAVGGVPPVGHKAPIQTFIDEDLLKFGVVWAAAGTGNAVVPLTTSQLRRITGATINRIL